MWYSCHMRFTTYRDHLLHLIGEHGHAVECTDGDETLPPHAYTIGLTARLGCELLVTGLPVVQAARLLNEIAAGWSPILLDVPTTCFTPEPLVLKECGHRLDELHTRYVWVGDQFYGRRVRLVQALIADQHGRTPLDLAYDHVAMDPVQPIFVHRQ